MSILTIAKLKELLQRIPDDYTVSVGDCDFLEIPVTRIELVTSYSHITFSNKAVQDTCNGKETIIWEGE